MSRSAGNFHESYRHEEEEHGPSERNFGLTVGGILVALGLIRGFLGHSGLNWLTYAFLVVGALLVLLALVRPAALRTLNRGWTKLGLLLFAIVNPIMMGLIFFTTILPIGLVMRARGKDLLRLKRDPAASTYWIERQPPGPAPETMINQF
jgi:hypothetical protein